MKEMLKLGIVLALFASISCVCLALVNGITAPAIAANKDAKASAGMKVVFEDADSFEKAKDFVPGDNGSILLSNLFLAKKAGKVVGAVVEANGPTYDKATVLVGVKLDRTMTGISFLALSDSPGYGQNALKETYMNQFPGKSIDDAFEIGKDYDAVSGATITSKGLANIFKVAGFEVGAYLAKNCGGVAGGSAPVVEKAPSVFTSKEACADIFASVEGVSFKEKKGNYLAYSSSKELVGALASASTEGFQDTITVIVGVDKDGKVLGLRVTEAADTPGLGLRIIEKEFYEQFAGKEADFADVDTISGATISSSAAIEAAKKAANKAIELVSQAKK